MYKRFLRAKQAWRRYDRHYGWKWRALNAAAACLVVIGAVVPIASQMLEAAYYNLSSDTLALVGKTDPTLLKQLNYSGADSTYQFNQKAVATASAASLNKLKQQVGTASGHGSDTSLYGLDVPTNYAKGVTYHDINSQLSFTMAPQFSAGTGKQVDGHLVFPLSLSTRAIYTLKNNGLKEDIVVSKATGDTMSFAYKLQLPKTLEAHKLADGSIGVYSADPSLYGAMTYGSAADRAAIQKARETGEKTHLVFGLPAPVVKNAHGQSVGEAHFDLDGSSLRVVATGLDSVKGTFTIDPSVVVTSTSDFQTGNNEGMISFGATGQITRDGLTSGAITSTPGTPAAPPVIAAVGASGLGVPSGVTNGSLVVAMVTGSGTGFSNPTITAPDPSWTQAGSNSYSYTSSSPTATHNVILTWWYHYATGNDSGTYAFSGGTGYALRITGGPTSGNPFADAFQQANTGGNTATSVTVPGWTPSGDNNLLLAGMLAGTGSGTISSLPSGWSTDVANSIGHTTQTTATATGNLTFTQSTASGLGVLIGTIRGVAGPGSGGWTATTSLPAALEQTGAIAYNGYLYEIGGSSATTAYSAPINGDGTIGAWTSAGSAVGSGNNKNFAVYNGYAYKVGDNATSQNVYYATIGNGTIGAWTKGTATPAVNNAAGVTIYQNYLYMVGGGPSGGGGNYYATVYYAPLNADGSVGSWTATTSLPTATGMNTAIAYNGYLYSIGGADTGFSANVYYAPINADGSVGAWTTTPSAPSSKYGQYSYIYDGYIYYVGGWTNTVTYYAPIYANGSLGSWQTTASLISTSGLRYVSGATYNGYMYILGGREESTSSDVATVQYAKIQPPGAITNYTSTTNVGASVAANKVTSNGTVVYGQCIYSVGGYYWNGSAQYTNAVFSASINSDGSLSAWTQSPNNMIYAAAGSGYAVSGNRLYVIGGYNGVGSQIQSTTLNSSTCSTGTWQQDATGYTPGNVGNHSAAAYNGYLYVVGTGGGTSSQVYSAQVNSDGTLGAWTQVSSLNTTRNKESMIVVGGYLYVAGGVDSGGNNLASVEYAKITGPGTLGSWTTTNSLSVGRSNFALVVHNGYIYALGGDTASSDTASVEYAMINGDGSVGPWQTNTSLGSSWKGGGYAISGNYIYLVCGKNGGVQGNLTYYVTINNGGNGQTGAWQTASNTFATTRSEHGTFAYNGYLYTIGGISGAVQALSDVQYAKINANGALGTWQATTSLPDTRMSFGLAEYNGYVYVLGGINDSSIDQQTTLYAKINTDGTIGTWQTGASFSGARSSLGAAAYAGYLYILGGDGLSDVQYAKINSDGSVGAWQATSSFANLLGNFGTSAYNGYLYTVGGSQYVNDPRGGYRQTSLSTVQYAKINSDGTIGSWQTTTSLGTARDSLNTVVYDGYMYALGGEDPSTLTEYNLVQYAAINANGIVGAWQTTNSFTTARHNASAAVYGGYVYLQGGINGSTTEGDTQYTPLNVIPRVGHYSKLIDLGSAKTVTSITYNGTLSLMDGMIPVMYRAAGTNGIFGAVSQLSGIGAGITARYLLVSSTFDDSQTAVFSDTSSTAAALTDFTVNYAGSSGHPSPAQRLHQGQTLQGGVLSPLDTISP